ncbi:BRO1 domain-containing protein BROX-like [Homarus americanus]|uniref:BRO1 domain-containing protein BROX-like n=1 Tax=Homarus americanus TaxID=6706 RepID=A0A8J5JJ38_HOMAM|nr:BRO1 domain-containing protein BROX-like [Homarus americanus]KAG7154059.1 BRO1 domain-containing protein BROX-like [Homarus americanus]
MAHWFHRNPLKATAEAKFDLKMVASDSQALKICSDLRQSRLRLLQLLPDANHEIDVVEPALTLYLSLLRGLIEVPEDQSSGWSKLRHSIRFRWTQSMLGNTPEGHFDAVFELVSVLQNAAFWYMKHAFKISAQDDVNMDEAKIVHRSLRRGAGLLKYVQEEWVNKLLETPPAGSDSDPRVHTAYLNQATAEAQEVTIARAIELKHNPGLVSALANETSKMFTTAADAITSLEEKKFGHWIKYFRLKASLYAAYAHNYAGQNMLNQDKCGEAIRSLQEAKKKYEEAGELCKEYARTKGPGTQAKPETHEFFRRLAPIVARTLEKCERENGMIYHQKVPYDPPELEMKATYGLVSPDDYTLPPAAPLWTAVTYSAFDLTKNLSEDPSANPKAAEKVEGDLPPVKEANIHQKSKDHKNNSGCSVM